MDPSRKKSAPRLRLRVTAAAESVVRRGHPWIYADSIREQNRNGQAGELAIIYDRHDHFFAAGLFDPDSPIRIRILHAGKPQVIDAAWWSARLDQAVNRRAGRFDRQTNGYRIINGESDGWPGLVLDRYDATLVLKLYTGAWLPRLDEIAVLIQERLQPEQLVLRLSRNVGRRPADRKASSLTTPRPAPETVAPSDATLLHGQLAGPVVFSETGLHFEADVRHGQKTGFFLDQRDNRRRVEALARGRRVLNAFSFSGGFSLYAARGGARSVTDLDISAHALASSRRNFELNAGVPGVAGCRHETVQADAFEWLETDSAESFDLIVLDPPSFAKREAERAGAIRAYEKLATRGISRLDRGGILVACSCSAHVSAEEFFGAVRRATLQAKRPFAELETTGHAADHPANFKEAEYLKGIYLRF